MADPLKCPHCDANMVKMFIEDRERPRWQGGWACSCKKHDWEYPHSGVKLLFYSSAPPNDLGVAINELLKQEEL